MLLHLRRAHGGAIVAHDGPGQLPDEHWLLLQHEDTAWQWSSFHRHMSSYNHCFCSVWVPSILHQLFLSLISLNLLEKGLGHNFQVSHGRMAGSTRLMLGSAMLRPSSFKISFILGITLRAQTSSGELLCCG